MNGNIQQARSPLRSILPYKRQTLGAPRPRRTNPLTWLAAIICALLWVIIALGGLAALIIYLVFRPKTPRVEISTASLNAAYIDLGTLLNADMTVLANFSNPNHKVDISYSYLVVDLYYNTTLIATQGVEPFAERRKKSAIKEVHLVASQAELPFVVADGLRQRVQSGDKVGFSLRGKFRTKSSFDGLARVSYWLHTSCDFVVSAPPGGVLQSSQCSTKR